MLRILALVLAPITLASLVFAAIQPGTVLHPQADILLPSLCTSWDQIRAGRLDAWDVTRLRAAAQKAGTYVQPPSSAELTLSVGDGLTFVDTVAGTSLGESVDPAMDRAKLARVRITTITAEARLIVLGSIALEPGLACGVAGSATAWASRRAATGIAWPPSWARGRTLATPPVPPT